MKDVKLVRSRSNKVLSGIFGGLAPILKIDVTILRLAFAFLCIFSGAFPGLIIYLVASVIIPLEDEEWPNSK
ncbi:PspC domain-containing protein [Bacillus sp. FJAT-27986]|uniref:PspC domain-containing protein n=1 Tax=Bacillus sp. FJAT-27986 TaxID=1743146 RepID=UPI00080ACD32|nr:PspC domain-containing protein [Bacillus sp. FJAT-27986]OCA86195.1 hypothetical protein A8L44_07210 [Bacillus sp. FJAT-27986]